MSAVGSAALVLALTTLTATTIGCAAEDAGVETPTEESALVSSITARIPVFFHFFYDRIDPATNLPGYLNPISGAVDTILNVEAELARFNAATDAVRPADGRRVLAVNAGVRYTQLTSIGCPDPATAIGADRVFHAINMLIYPLPDSCAGMATAPYLSRARTDSVVHELGHNMGLYHTFNGNSNLATVERLERDKNPGKADGCYHRGDFTCDTPPDYGYAPDFNVCDTLIPGTNLCTQFGLPCLANDPIVDGRGLCMNIFLPGTTVRAGRRFYDPRVLGLDVTLPGNIMAYHTQSSFTAEQVMRLSGYARFRMTRGEAIPAAEKAVMFNFWPDESHTQIWSNATNFNLALANLTSASASFAMTSTAVNATGISRTTTQALGSGRRVLRARVALIGTGTPSSGLTVTVTPPNGPAAVVSGANVRVSGSNLTADDSTAVAVDTAPLSSLRGRRVQGKWTVTVADSGNGSLRLTNIKLILDETDRGYLVNDRLGSGASDVMVYEPPTGRLWRSANTFTGRAEFGGGVFEQPNAPAGKVIGGDVDGDGGMDLVSWQASTNTMKVALNRNGYSAWMNGAINETDRPGDSDELLMGDFDGDGFGDIMRRRPDAALNRGVWKFHRGYGDGTFAGAQPAVTGDGLAYFANAKWTAGDFNGDGYTDIMVRINGNGQMWISTNITAAPGAVPVFAGGGNPTIDGVTVAFNDADRLMAMDVNFDGRDDIVVRRNGTGAWMAAINTTPGQAGVFNRTFAAPASMLIGGGTTAYLDSEVMLGAVN